MTIRHFVITRFNVRASPDPASKALDVAWLQARCALFEQFCWPSVRYQTQQSFEWLVLLDQDTPAAIRARIDEYAKWPNFIPVYLPPGTPDLAKEAVSRVLGAQWPEVLITTRLDNDDSLALDYIEHVQRYAHTSQPIVVEFPIGFVWSHQRLYRDWQPLNAFISLIEPLQAQASTGLNAQAPVFSTVYSGAHPDAHRLGRVVCATKQPSWVQVVHGGNLENRPRGVRCSMRQLDQRFSIDCREWVANEKWAPLWFERLTTAPLALVFNALRQVKRMVTALLTPS